MSGPKPDTSYGNRWYNYLMGYGPYPYAYAIGATAPPRKAYTRYVPWINKQDRLLRDVGEALDIIHNNETSHEKKAAEK